MFRTRYPTAATCITALLGSPLSHSLSSPLHNAVYKKKGLDYLYLPLEVEKEQLAAVIAGLKAVNCAGFNVTIPHKVEIIKYLDILDPLAEKIGAVNTVCLQKSGTEKKAAGFNTDGIGFLRSLQERSGADASAIWETSFLIFGAGGAARAIAFTLAEYGAGKITLCNRTFTKAKELSDAINTAYREEKTAVIPAQDPYIKEAARVSAFLINTTSCGMTPDTGLPLSPHFSPQSITPAHTVVDIVYNPYTTPLLEAAKTRGAKIVRGWAMLLYQGVSAFTLFTGRELDKEDIILMKEILLQRLSA